MSKTEKFEQCGFSFERQHFQLISVTYSSRTIKLGQIVTSNGHIEPKGHRGEVVKINLPYTDGRTSDILDIIFEGSLALSQMKFKDLELK